MLKRGITYILPGDKWETRFEDIPCTYTLEDEYYFYTKPLIQDESIGDTGMSRDQMEVSLKTGLIKGNILSSSQKEYFQGLLGM